MKLNCDLGEYALDDENCPDAQIMPLIDMANIACGYHAGCPQTMRNTVASAIQHKVLIGAHPSYHDRANFGRVHVEQSEQQIISLMVAQINSLQQICQALGTSIDYVKPHGALYNDMMQDEKVFRAVCQSIATLPNSLPLMIQATTNCDYFQQIANQYQLTLWFEAFADRSYQENGLLVSRTEKNAVLTDIEKIITRCQQLIIHQEIETINSSIINLKVDSLCVHGDNPHALAMVQSLRKLLSELHE